MRYTITYTQQGTSILATIVDSNGKDSWPDGHYLSAVETEQLTTDPNTLHASLVLAVPQPHVDTPPPTPPTPVVLSTTTFDATTAAATVATYNATNQAITDGLAALIEQSKKLPIAQRAAILSNAKAAVTAALAGK